MSDVKVPSTNSIIIAGRAGADAQVSETTGGTTVGEFRLANTYYRRNQDGTRDERTCWIRVVGYGATAEYMARSVGRGRPVIVEGRLDFDEWTDRDTGARRSAHKVVATRVSVLDWDEGSGAGPEAGAERADVTRADEEIPF